MAESKPLHLRRVHWSATPTPLTGDMSIDGYTYAYPQKQKLKKIHRHSNSFLIIGFFPTKILHRKIWILKIDESSQ